MPGLVANRVFDLGGDPERGHKSGARSDLVPGQLPDFVSSLLRTLARIEKEIGCYILHKIMYHKWYLV